MNIITAILTMICQLFMAIFGPLFQRVRPSAAAAGRIGIQARNSLIVVVAVTVIAGSLISLFYTMRPASVEQGNHDLFIGLGQALADETLKELHNNGRLVVVVSPDFLTKGSVTYLELSVFQKELKKHAGIDVIATEQVAVPETSPDQNLPRADFDKILKQYLWSAAIVSFIGLPAIEPENPLTIPAHAPKIIAIYNLPAAAKAYFTSSIATVLIIPRGSSGNQPTAPKTPRESFDRYFRVCTTANYESLPD